MASDHVIFSGQFTLIPIFASVKSDAMPVEARAVKSSKHIVPNEGFSSPGIAGGKDLSGSSPNKGFGPGSVVQSNISSAVMGQVFSTSITTPSPTPRSSTSALTHSTTPMVLASPTTVLPINKTAVSSPAVVPTSALPSVSSTGSRTGFFHNRAAVGGVVSVGGIVIIVGLAVGYMLLRRRLARRRRADKGPPGTGAWAVLPSRSDMIQQGNSSMHRLSTGREVENSDAMSIFSVNASRRSSSQPSMDANNVTTYHSSLYTNTTLPPYPSTIRSLSPPGYSELSLALSERRESDVVRYSGILGQGGVYPLSESEKDQLRSGAHS